jgi:hypothetical protein
MQTMASTHKTHIVSCFIIKLNNKAGYFFIRNKATCFMLRRFVTVACIPFPDKAKICIDRNDFTVIFVVGNLKE